jgi:hypothetical protein
MKIYIEKKYVSATFDEIMSILAQNKNQKITCLNTTK